jgi:hypothetical protein
VNAQAIIDEGAHAHRNRTGCDDQEAQPGRG